MRPVSKRTLPLLAGLLLVGACERFCQEPLAQIYPRLVVSPERVDLPSAGVAQDTSIIITLENPSNAELRIDDIWLDPEHGDPAFRIVEKPDVVLASESAQVRVVVRPRVLGRIETTLFIDAEDAALPNSAEVPIAVTGVDLGLPDICVDKTEVDFGRIGQNDVARETITICNDGVRDLIIDSTELVSDVEGDEALRVIPLPPGTAIPPGESLSVNLVFAPTDTELHSGVLQIRSNDPDEELIEIPVQGRGSLCPVAVAELVDDLETVEPLDTIRITGENSYSQSDGTEVADYEWRLAVRPQGSTAVLDHVSPDRVQLTCDLAGDYEVHLTVIDTDEVRSCEDEVVRIHVEPSEDLHIQLVWDHPDADLDLHLLNEGGEIFTHEGDVYFSNRAPEWSDDADTNPTLDKDDSRGYGPENINIKHPAPGSNWRVFVHYWNKQTDGDAFTIATLRVYAYGQLVAEIPQSFENDQLLWRALEIQWADEPDVMPQLNQIGQMEEFPRPF